MMSLACSAAQAQNPRSDQLWVTNCARCHGDRGQGGGAGTPSLLTGKYRFGGSDRELFDSIKKGHPEAGMEAFGEGFSNEQIWAMVNYLRELQENDRRKTGQGVPKETGGVYKTERESYRIVDVVAKGLRTPWAVAFLSADRMLITERPGQLRVFEGGKLSTPVAGLPAIVSSGQGGLMDVELHPEHEKNGWIYLAFSHAISGGEGRRGGEFTMIVRGKLAKDGEGYKWTDNKTIFEARPGDYSGPGLHYGCHITFQRAEKPDGEKRYYVFFGIGERGIMDRAQDLKRPNGKVFRVWDDGSTPSDNPFVDVEGAYGQIWSYGHRNPQGLMMDLKGRLWDTEHGPRGGDELNLVKRGKNYGWPVVSYGINYSGTPFRTPWKDTAGDRAKDVEIEMPTLVWLPSIAACGLDVVRPPREGKGAFPNWEGDLLAGGLAGQTVRRVRVDDAGKLVETEEVFYGHGRVRDVVCGPDGSIYVALNDPDKIVRLVPAK